MGGKGLRSGWGVNIERIRRNMRNGETIRLRIYLRYSAANKIQHHPSTLTKESDLYMYLKNLSQA